MLQLPEVLSSLQVIYLGSHSIAVGFLEVKAQEIEAQGGGLENTDLL